MRKKKMFIAAFVCIFLSFGSTLYAYDITGQWNLEFEWTGYDPNDDAVVIGTGTDNFLHAIAQDNDANTFVMHNYWTGTFSGPTYTVTGDMLDDTTWGAPYDVLGYFRTSNQFALFDTYEFTYQESSNTLDGIIEFHTYDYDPDNEAWALVSIGDGVITGTPVPVPSSMFLLGSGLVGLVGVARKKRKK